MALGLSVRTKFSLAVLLTVALTVAVTLGVTLYHLSRFADQEAAGELRIARLTVERSLDLCQQVALANAETLAALTSLQEAVETADRALLLRLIRRASQERKLDYISVTNADGIVLARAHAPDKYGDDLSALPVFDLPLHGLPTAMIFHSPRAPLAAGGGAPVFEPRPPYRLLGAVVAGYELGDAFVAELKKAIGHDVSLIVENARLHSTLPASAPPEPAFLGTASASEGFPVTIRVADQPYRALYGRLIGRYGGDPVGYFEVAKSQRGVQATQSRMIKAVASAVAVVGLMAVGLAVWLAQRISRPLATLTTIARAFGQGDFDRRVDLKTGDEVEFLGNAFNEMATAVQQGQAQLLASEGRFRDLYDNAPVAYLSIDVTDHIRRCNKAAVGLFGAKDAADLVGRPRLDLFPDTPQAREAASMVLQRFLAGEEIQDEELQMRRLDGTPIRTSLTVNPIRDPDGRVVESRSIVLDITERKRAEEALRAAEARYRALVERIPAVTYTAAPDESGSTLFISPQIETMLRFTPDEWLADPELRAKRLHPGDRERVLAEYVRAYRAGEPFRSEYRVLTRDGQTIWVRDESALERDGNGQALFVQGVMLDITGRKEAEVRLQQQVSRLHLLNQITRAISERLDAQSIVRIAVSYLEEHLPADYGCVCRYDPAEAKLTVLVSGVKGRPIAHRLGLDEGAVIPTAESGLHEIVGGGMVYVPDTAQSAVPLLHAFAGAGLRSFAAAPLVAESATAWVVAMARREPNSFTSVECEFLRMLGEQLGLAIHQAQLYTQLEQAYTDLRQTQQAILQQERLRALGQMASGIAHDINNAISPAALYLETLLEDEATLTPQAQARLTTIQRALEDVAQTVERLRNFYRPRQPQEALIPVDLNALVRQVVDLTRPRWRDQPPQRGVVIAVQTDLQPDLPLVPGLESELRDALTNLIFNAVDAMPEGGTLTLRTFQEAEGRTQGAEGRGTVGSRRKAEGGEPETPETEDVPLLPTAFCQLPTVVIEVADTGVGMDAETRLRCLEPFFTTKGERGTGLGLAMVYGIMQRHGGEIAIASEVGQGTTVQLLLPAAPAAAERVRVAAGARPTRRLRLLVVDDDPLLRQSLQDTLSAEGHAVAVAAGGQEGIEAFRAAQTRGEAFDVVITDLGMPHVDGREVARAVKAAAPATPVLLLTGWGVRLGAENHLSLQVDHILGKPPKLRDLREALAALTEQGQERRGDDE